MLRRLGNLDLLTPAANSKADRESFANKKQKYAAGPLPLTRDLATYAEPWNLERITERQRKLAKIAVGVWTLALSSGKKPGGKKAAN